MRHLIYNAVGLKSAYITNPETGDVHKSAAIPEIADVDSPLVKTHDLNTRPFDAAIHIVRNPFNAIASYLDYCHRFNVPIQRRSWFIKTEAIGWNKHSEYWRLARESGVLEGYHRVRYEDLLVDTNGELWKVVHDFLGFDIDPGAVEQAVTDCSLAKMQAKGSEEFYPKGFSRRYSDTLTRVEIDQIGHIVRYELAHLINDE